MQQELEQAMKYVNQTAEMLASVTKQLQILLKDLEQISESIKELLDE